MDEHVSDLQAHNPIKRESYLDAASSVIRNARSAVARSVNLTMVYAYFEIGRIIVEEEQGGEKRAEYGKQIIKRLSMQLTKEFGKGYSIDNLKLMRRFYVVYSKEIIGETVIPQSANLPTTKNKRAFSLSWSHYLKLMRMEDAGKRRFYEIEADRSDWSVRELQRQIDSGLYERIALSKDPEGTNRLAKDGQSLEKPADIIKDPYILEFLGLKEESSYSESELEEKIIDNLQDFMLELGRGFTFVGRQQRFTYEEDHFMVDLVFYNRLLRCFVLLDLKIGKLAHQDIGQMQMYVHYYDRCVKLEEENPTIGILLCQDKNDAVVEMTLPEGNEQIFASRYKTVLPSKEELQKLLSEANEVQGHMTF